MDNRLGSKNRILYLTFIFLLPVFLSACDRRQKISLPGYVEGKFTYISANYSGILKTLDVRKGNEVRPGQLLFTLMPQPEYYEYLALVDRVAQAKQQEAELEIEADFQKTLLDRRLKLQQNKFISKEDVDTSISRYRESSSRLSAARNNYTALQADLNKAKWVVNQKTVNSPFAGLVFDTYFTPGELVAYDNPVVSLLDPTQVKIIFYSPEALLSGFKLNQRVEITCDYCDRPIKGAVVFISPKAEYTPPVIYSNEVRDKLVYRIEVQPLIKNAYLVLHPGQPITVNSIR